MLQNVRINQSLTFEKKALNFKVKETNHYYRLNQNGNKTSFNKKSVKSGVFVRQCSAENCFQPQVTVHVKLETRTRRRCGTF